MTNSASGDSYKLPNFLQSQHQYTIDFHRDPFYHKALQYLQQGSWQQATFLLKALTKVYRDATELTWLLEDIATHQAAERARGQDKTTGQVATTALSLPAPAKLVGQEIAALPSVPVPSKQPVAPSAARRLPRWRGTLGWPASRFWQVVTAHGRSMKWSVFGALLATLGEAVTDLLSPWPLKLILDVLITNQPLSGWLALINTWVGGQVEWLLLFLSLLIAVIAMLNGLFTYLGTFLTTRIGFQLVSVLRQELFIHMQRLPLSFHVTTKRGELLTKISTDVQTVRDVFAETGLALFTNWLSLIGMLVVMVYVNWQLSLIPLLTTPLLYFVVTRMRGKLRTTVQNQRREEGKMVSQISENLSSISVVKAFGREAHETERFETENKKNLTEGIQTARFSSAMSRMVNSISALGLAAVVFFGAWQALLGRITPGDVVLFVSYVKGVYKPIREIAKLSAKMTKAMVSVRRISEILEMETEEPDSPEAIAVNHFAGKIEVRHVTFAYSSANRPGSSKPILEDVSFTIQPGQRVALIGASGSGKSTLIHLLLRLYEPQFGTLLLDGVDIRNYQRQSMRRHIGLVLQDSILVGASIRENIAYGKPEASQNEIEEAARQAHIHEFIVSLPDGYETLLGENGSTLSGGQRQRIAIARALVKRPAILILDEPTSALDAESQAQVQETLMRLEQVRTILVVTHQLSLVQNFDLILVLNEGAIVERGQHETLLEAGGLYAQLYELQQGSSAKPTGRATM